MSKLNILYAMSMVLIGSANFAIAQTVTIPNTFTPGTPARAEDVNANFTAVATAVNGSGQNIAALQGALTTIQSTPVGGLTVSVGGTPIGSLFSSQLECEEVYASGDPLCTDTPGQSYIVTVSSKGFLAQIATAPLVYNGTTITTWGLPEGSLYIPNYVFYDQSNCAGNAYAGSSAAPFIIRQGFVFGAINPSDANQSYYIQGTPTTVPTVSYQTAVVSSSGVVSTPQCTSGPPPSAYPNYYLMSPNNPSVTGIPVSVAGSITIATH